jgi:hypothetical protein
MCDFSVRPLINSLSFLGDFKKGILVYLGHQMYDDRPDPVGCATLPHHYRDNAIMLNFQVMPPEESRLTLAHMRLDTGWDFCIRTEIFAIVTMIHVMPRILATLLMIPLLLVHYFHFGPTTTPIKQAGIRPPM